MEIKSLAELLVSNQTLLALAIVGLVALATIVQIKMKSVETPDIT